MDSFFYGVRKLTIAPVLAVIAVLMIRLCVPGALEGAAFWEAVFFLGVLPVMAYPAQRFLPGFRDKGREGQRRLAMIFAVCGYLGGCIVNLLTGAARELWMIYLEYLLSGILIFAVNKAADNSKGQVSRDMSRRKISGHACGVVGPLALFWAFGIYQALLPGLLLLALVYVASLRTKRHTLPQLVGGSVVPVLVMALLQLLGF